VHPRANILTADERGTRGQRTYLSRLSSNNVVVDHETNVVRKKHEVKGTRENDKSSGNSKKEIETLHRIVIGAARLLTLQNDPTHEVPGHAHKRLQVMVFQTHISKGANLYFP
jgi:hypothetical protein